MRRHVVLAVSCVHRCVAKSIHGVALRLIDMQRNHSYGSHATGSRDIDPCSRTGNGIRCRERVVVGNGPDGFDLPSCHDLVCQIKRSTGFAAW